jgi:hypothetical protein
VRDDALAAVRKCLAAFAEPRNRSVIPDPWARVDSALLMGKACQPDGRKNPVDVQVRHSFAWPGEDQHDFAAARLLVDVLGKIVWHTGA